MQNIEGRVTGHSPRTEMAKTCTCSHGEERRGLRLHGDGEFKMSLLQLMTIMASDHLYP